MPRLLLVVLLAGVVGLQEPENAWFRRGYELLSLGKEAEAEEAFVKALEEEPGHARSAIFLSRIYVRSDRWEQAVEILSSALAIRPEGIALLNELGSLYLDHQRYQEAEATFRKAVGVLDDNVRAMAGLAQSLAALGRAGEAMELLEEAIETRPGARSLFFLLATLQIAYGQYDEGLRALGEAETAGSSNPGISVYRGIALAGLGKVEEAIATLEQAVKDNPEGAEAHRHLGLLLQASDPARSVEHLQEAARLLPESADIKVALALSLARAGRLGEAQTEIEAARALDPSSAALDPVEGLILLALNRDQEALAHLSRAVERDPGDSPSWLALGKVFHRLGHLDRAEQAFSEAKKADPTNAEASYYLGEMALADRRFEEALEHYQSAITYQPGYVEADRQKAVALQRMGRHGEAVEVLEKALVMAPQDVELLYTLGSVLSEAGDDEAAVSRLLEARDIHPYHAQTRYLLGTTLAKLRRQEESREELRVFRELKQFENETEEFENILLSHPDEAQSYIPLIQHYLDHGREVEALPFIEKALVLSPDDLELLLLAGRARLASGQADLAREAADRALSLHPDNADALALREKVEKDQAKP